MNFQKFTNPDGTVDCFVNLDAIVAAKPADDGKVILLSSTLSVTVDAAQFEKAVAGKGSDDNRFGPLLARLTQAVDRLAVRIPTTIRLHM